MHNGLPTTRFHKAPVPVSRPYDRTRTARPTPIFMPVVCSDFSWVQLRVGVSLAKKDAAAVSRMDTLAVVTGPEEALVAGRLRSSPVNAR